MGNSCSRKGNLLRNRANSTVIGVEKGTFNVKIKQRVPKVDPTKCVACGECENCHHAWGNYMQERRIEMLNESLQLLGVNDKLVKWEYIGVPHWKKLANSIRQMNQKLKEIKEGCYAEA